MLQFLFCANEYRIESEQVRRLEGVFADPQLSGIRNAPLLSLAYHLACGVDCSACFDLDEDNHPVFLRDYVNFANLAGPVCFQNFKAVRQKVTLCRSLAALAEPANSASSASLAASARSRSRAATSAAGR